MQKGGYGFVRPDKADVTLNKLPSASLMDVVSGFSGFLLTMDFRRSSLHNFVSAERGRDGVFF